MSELTRANKITAYWETAGVAVGVFYKTHTKILKVQSNDADVVAAGFVMPEGTAESPVTAQEKLTAFKNFLQVNASVFGIQYDPVDRRSDEFKFPNKYDEETFRQYSKEMAQKSVDAVLVKVQNNVVNNMIKSGHIADGTVVEGVVDDMLVMDIKESYNNGNIKYADATYPVFIQVGDNTIETSIVVSVVSGQLKKPRELADDVVLTQTGVKTLLIENGLLPKIEKPSKDKDADAEVEDTEVEMAEEE